MKILVGLGNIGKEYADTRHNVGFMVIDKMAEKLGVTAWQTKWQAQVATAFSPCKLMLVKPNTYMNLSGNAVREIANFYNVEPENIAVIHDDLDLPCGKIRIRAKGSAGGHNGVRSIIENLGSQTFPRFKIGIGQPPNKEQGKDRKVIKHVLERFNSEEQQVIDEAVEEMCQALLIYLKDGIDLTMNRCNPSKTAPPKEEA